VNTTQTTDTLAPGLTVRPPTMADLAGVVALMQACDVAENSTEFGDPTEELRQGWEKSGFDLTTQAWVVCDAQGQIVGYEEYAADGDEYELDGYVHPTRGNQGIGTYLVRQVETRLTGSGKPATVTISAKNTAAQQLFAAMGYTWQRGFWVMKIHLTAPPVPTWPEGVSLAPFSIEGNSHAFHEMMETAFQDHWEWRWHPYEEWALRFQRSDFDPTLYFPAVAPDGSIVGGASCRLRTPEFGWVQGLGVDKAWRGHGLGTALLHHAFNVFYNRGVYTVGLAVDSQSLTGATRLYQRAGMFIDKQYDHLIRQF
jgi:mycothiol synthase